MKFNNIGIIGKYGVANIKEPLFKLREILQGKNLNFYLESETSERYGIVDFKIKSRADIGKECDLVIVLGGDGSFLNAARDMAHNRKPMLGINLGRLGFLTEIAPDNMDALLTDILNGQYESENRYLLSSEIIRDGEMIRHGLAMNDVVVHKWNVARMIEFETRINNKFVNIQRSDGIIISSPTGSTAYALSGGGPIIEPAVNAIVLVSICPHTLSYRPLVINGNSTIEIKVLDGALSKAQVTCDGQMNLGLVSGDIIKISKSPHFIELIHPQNHDIYKLLRDKFAWGLG